MKVINGEIDILVLIEFPELDDSKVPKSFSREKATAINAAGFGQVIDPLSTPQTNVH